MLGSARTDTRQAAKVSLYPSPSILSKTQLAIEGPDSVGLGSYSSPGPNSE